MSENAGTSADSTGGTSPTDPYAEGVKTLRETAKWLTTAFAALGTAMLAGTQLSKIGQLGLADLRLLLRVAQYCTVLRSRWCQSDVNISLVPT